MSAAVDKLYSTVTVNHTNGNSARFETLNRRHSRAQRRIHINSTMEKFLWGKGIVSKDVRRDDKLTHRKRPFASRIKLIRNDSSLRPPSVMTTRLWDNSPRKTLSYETRNANFTHTHDRCTQRVVFLKSHSRVRNDPKPTAYLHPISGKQTYLCTVDPKTRHKVQFW